MKKSKDVKAFNILSYTIVALIALFCFIPFLIVVMGSITDEKKSLLMVSHFSQINYHLVHMELP